MKLNFFKTIVVAFSLLAFVSSCKKDSVPDQYLRGGNGLTLADDGNLVIAGYNTSASRGFDASLILANPTNGDTIWNRNFGGLYSDAFFSVKKANGGGFIATGFSNRSSSNSPSMFVVMTDANGTQTKSLKYGSSYYSQGFCVLPHANPDSGYLVTGYIQNSSATDRDIYLVHINNAGETVWEKRYGAKSAVDYDTVNDAAYSIITAPDGGYFLTGSMHAYSTCCGKIFLMKVSAKGDSLWTKIFNYGIGYSLSMTSDGYLAIGGTSQSTDHQGVVIIKTDTAGNIKWENTYGGSSYAYGTSMVMCADGGYAITGISNTQGAGTDDILLLRMNTLGELMWSKTYGGTNIDQGFGLVQHSDGGFTMTGLSNSGGSYIYLNRTSSDGTQEWFKDIK